MAEKNNGTQGAYSRRAFLKMAGVSAAAVALAACAVPTAPAPAATGGGEAAAPAAEAVKLTTMAFGQADQPGFQAMADAYMAANPNVTIEAVFLPNDENYYAALQAQYAGGSNPDIASMQAWAYQLFADNQVIYGLNELRARDAFDYAWDDSAAVKDYVERNGDTYLVPLQSATMVMYYAKKLFDEAGLAYPTDDWTFDEFVEIATKLTNTSGDKKQWGYEANGNWFRDIHWIRGTGKQEFDTLVDPKTSMFNQPEIVNPEGVVIFDTAPLDPAWDYTMFMAGEEGQKIWSDATGRMPNNMSLVESYWAPKAQETYGLTNTQAFITAFQKGEIDIVSGLPRSQYWNEVIKPVGWDVIIANSATAAEVLPQVDAGVQQMFDDYWASKG